jgi:transposase
MERRNARMAQPTYQQLLEIIEQKDRRIAEQDRQIAALQARVTELEGQVARLTKLLEQAHRSGKRQAAPFSKGGPKPDPKRPGRKSGPNYGTRAFRPPPPPRQIDEIYEAPLPTACSCGGSVHETHVVQQYQVEIPRRPTYRQFNVHVGNCCRCGRRVQGRHPLQTSDALGAAASQLGPDLQAGIVHLNKEAGLPHGKIQRVLKMLFGVELSRGGSVQAMQRTARRCEPTYHAIVKAMSRQPWVVPDETGWRIGGLLAWLHVFVAPRLTCYAIDRQRGIMVPESILGLDYAGVLIHDGWKSYDQFWEADHQQCLAHLLRRCEEMIKEAAGGAARFPRQVQTMLQGALALRNRHQAGEVSDHGLAVAVGLLEKRRDRLLTWIRTDPANERLAKHLNNHRDQLFTFLHQPGLDATNWRAEQAIRPAVVNRKVWGGNRTEAGAHAQSILMSVIRTCAQQGRDAMNFMSRLLRGESPQLVFSPPAAVAAQPETR